MFYIKSFLYHELFYYFPAGCMKIKLKAWNIFSSMEMDVHTLATCSNDTDIKEVKYHILFLFFLACFLRSLYSVQNE